MKKFFSLLFLVFFSSGYIQSQTFVQEQNTVRVMSYNIRNAIGMDQNVDYERIADVISSALPDVVALQEVDSVTERSGKTDVLGRLSNLTKMYSVYGASIPFQGGKYGIGVLSREKPVSYQSIPLPGREEARSALIVEFSSYIFCCTHLSLSQEDRETSVTILSDLAHQYDKPVLLAGDFNFTPQSEEFKKLTSVWKVLNNPKQATFPADQPKEVIDYICGYTGKEESYAVHQARVLTEPVASDHRPVMVDFRLKTKTEEILRTQPYLQYPSTDGMTVMWLTHVPCHSWVEYGTDSTHMQRARTYVEGEAMANNTLNRIRLNNLQPGTRYYYRIYSREITLYKPYYKEFGNTAVSELSSFTTLDDTQKDFTAIVFNDLHDNYTLFDKLFSQIKDISYDLVFFNGDCIADVESEANAVRSISYYCSAVKGNHVPCIFLRGNHETRGAYSMFLWNLLERMGGHSYGAFNVGDTRFVLLDCGEDKPDSTWVYYDLNDFTQHREDQAVFLKKEINSGEYKSAGKRVLIHHIPIYGKNLDRYVPCKELWGDILSGGKFNISLNAHTHEMEYITKGEYGNSYPVVIGGGNNEESGTVMILQKKGKIMTLKVLNVKGDVLLDIEV